MKKIVILMLFAVVLYANKCFILTGHYNLFSENEKKAYLAGLHDRFDYEIRVGSYQLNQAQREHLDRRTVDDVKKLIDSFIEKNSIFRGNPIESYCLSDIFGFVMQISLENKRSDMN